MAKKLPRPIEDYLIGKHDNGVCCYLITREAYHNWAQHGATVKHSCINYNGGQDLAQYPLQPKAKYKAFEFNKMPIEWQPILTKSNAELAKQLCEYWSKSKGKFDHIKPDKVWFVDYGSNDSLYIVDREEYSKPSTKGLNKSEWAAWLLNPGYDLSKQHATIGVMPRLEFDMLNQQQLTKFNKLNPELYKHFEDFYAKQAAVKSEPTPDDYYVVKHCDHGWITVLRKPWDKGHAREGEFNYWRNNQCYFSGIHNKQDKDNDRYWPINNKKFPQLSSEIKQELQTQNPERYKEWEDFYVKKYPNMQRLDTGKTIHELLDLKPSCGCGICKDCLSRRPLPNPADDYIVVGCNGIGIMPRHYFKGPMSTGVVYSTSFGWVNAGSITERDETVLEHIKRYAHNEPMAAIIKQFEQYYTELEQKKVAEKQYPKIGEYYEIPVSDFDIMAYENANPYFILKADRAKLGTCENYIGIDLQTLNGRFDSPYLGKPYSYIPSQKYLYVHENWMSIPHSYSELAKIWGKKIDWTEKAKSIHMATFNKPQSDRDKLLTDLKVAEDTWNSPDWNIYFIKDPKDYVIVSTPAGWGFMPSILFDDGSTKCRLWSSVNRIAYIDHRKALTIDTMDQAPCLSSRYSLKDVQKAMKKSNLPLWNIFTKDSDPLLYKRPDPFIASNIMIVSSAETPALGWTFIDAGLWNSLSPNDKYSACGWRDTNRFTRPRTKREGTTAFLLSEADSGKLAVLKRENLSLYNQAIGSDFDIDTAAMESYWQSQVLDNWAKASPYVDSDIRIKEEPKKAEGRGKKADMIFFEEVAPFKYPSEFGKTSYLSAGVDPYQADFETQGVVTIWKRDYLGKIINRVYELDSKDYYRDFSDWYANQAEPKDIEIYTGRDGMKQWEDVTKKLYETFNHNISPQDYYNLLMNDPNVPGQDVQGMIISKARRVGQTKFYEDVAEIAKYYGNKPIPQSEGIMTQINRLQFISPNTKINNHEIINVPRKTITITSGQEYSRSIISSYRCAPAVTAEHTKYGQEPCRGQEKSGSCKIS